ncbi:DUF2460 domain-containing protein [Methylovulum psychrotolerans]|uniref:DUF2460 domain-containing protein n=1 Tax=Methylovulum psychrotolerans TaxID=1704499 RepID=A0A1Z4C0B9_9GAMM|nr:DUF2460 domain-containing protein [Methylovulum psychrotolerans]ASF46994.1 hypothetical protein CEK71_13445 [Methylovulum psychrotolerans]
MSDLILPNFIGFAMDRKRNPEFATVMKTTASGREIRQRFSAYPLWHFTVPISFLQNDLGYGELNQLMGFIIAHGGQEDTWLYDCPRYNFVESMFLGNGDGSRTTFQLRVIEQNYGFIELVNNPKDDVSLFVGGELQTGGYSIDGTGLVTFDSAPPDGARVEWSGGYYHRCRFDAAIPDFNESAVGVFDYADFSFIGSPVNKL